MLGLRYVYSQQRSQFELYQYQIDINKFPTLQPSNLTRQGIYRHLSIIRE